MSPETVAENLREIADALTPPANALFDHLGADQARVIWKLQGRLWELVDFLEAPDTFVADDIRAARTADAAGGEPR